MAVVEVVVEAAAVDAETSGRSKCERKRTMLNYGCEVVKEDDNLKRKSIYVTESKICDFGCLKFIIQGV